jgi:hypothetical protein
MISHVETMFLFLLRKCPLFASDNCIIQRSTQLSQRLACLALQYRTVMGGFVHTRFMSLWCARVVIVLSTFWWGKSFGPIIAKYRGITILFLTKYNKKKMNICMPNMFCQTSALEDEQFLKICHNCLVIVFNGLVQKVTRLTPCPHITIRYCVHASF